jgi:hypothetical protein
MVPNLPVDSARRVDRVTAAEAGDERLFLARRVTLVGAETLDTDGKRGRTLQRGSGFQKPSITECIKTTYYL